MLQEAVGETVSPLRTGVGHARGLSHARRVVMGGASGILPGEWHQPTRGNPVLRLFSLVEDNR